MGGTFLSNSRCSRAGRRKLRATSRAKPRAKQSLRTRLRGSCDECAKTISHSPMIPALFPHSFGGHPEGVLGACPFKTLHQTERSYLLETTQLLV
jgi:hypothetical protein